VAEAVFAPGQPVERGLDLGDLTALAIHQGDLDLVVQRLARPRVHVGVPSRLLGPALADYAPHRLLQLALLGLQELLELAARPPVQSLGLHRGSPSYREIRSRNARGVPVPSGIAITGGCTPEGASASPALVSPVTVPPWLSSPGRRRLSAGIV
jgi:hypothetical protein